MGQISKTDKFKQAYYTITSLTEEEALRYFQFIPSLLPEQIQIVRNWYDTYVTENFALIDEDYIFFTRKIDCDNFKIFWAEQMQNNKSTVQQTNTDLTFKITAM